MSIDELEACANLLFELARARGIEKMLAEPARASSVDLDRVAHLIRLLSDQLAF